MILLEKKQTSRIYEIYNKDEEASEAFASTLKHMNSSY